MHFNPCTNNVGFNYCLVSVLNFNFDATMIFVIRPLQCDTNKFSASLNLVFNAFVPDSESSPDW